MQKGFLILALITLAVSSALNEDSAYKKFQNFIKKYNKQYSSIEEFMARFSVFKRSLNRIKAHKTWKQGITKFSDMTVQEFRKQYLNLNVNALAGVKYTAASVTKGVIAPESFNWLDKDVLGEVKNQGSCGSCYAFSTMGNLEGLYAIKTGNKIVLGEQLIVDCDTDDAGCNGGLMELTFDWIKGNGGVELEEDYPYTGREGRCRSDPSKYVADLKVTGYKKLGDPSKTWSPVDEGEIRDFLYETGPLAIALNADALMYYDSGIIDVDEYECDPEGMNHAVVLVGYGNEDGLDYWIVRNSWGKNWGEQGYFRIARGKGTCGINQYITTAILE